MKINESSWDSIICVFSGFFLLYLGLGGELTGPLALLANVFGLFLLLTGVVGFCPLYTLFKWKKLVICAKEFGRERISTASRLWKLKPFLKN